MGITIFCKKTGRSIDLGYGGFAVLRERVAKLAGEPFGSHYEGLRRAPILGEARKTFFEAFDRRTVELIEKKQVSIKVASFCLQPDAGGRIGYGGCKELLKVIGDYDDNILYGYAGRKDCAMFKDFKAILTDCAETKCDMVWS